MKTLIVFSHLRWNFVFQRPQHLLTRLAQHYQIIYVEEPMHTDALPYVQFEALTTGVSLLVTHINDESWGFSDANIKVIGPMLVDWIGANALDLSEGYGLMFYTPQALPLCEYFDPKVIVFDIMDELSLFKGAPPELKRLETELMGIADVVIAGGPSLWKSKSAIRSDIINLPSAVDASHFTPENALRLEVEKHVDDQLEHDIPHPRLGFFGVIDERLDVELIEALADADLKWHIVMVGPVVKIDPAVLPQRPNIHWLGSQSYNDLPMLVQGWDVCLLPFAINDATKFISPTKTLEYMAGEKPVVSTNIHDVVELYAAGVEIGNTHEEFIAKVKELLHESEVEAAMRRASQVELVSHHSWDKAVEIVHQAIEDAVARKIIPADSAYLDPMVL